MPRMTIEERTYYWYVFRIYIHYPISLPAHPVFISFHFHIRCHFHGCRDGWDSGLDSHTRNLVDPCRRVDGDVERFWVGWLGHWCGRLESRRVGRVCSWGNWCLSSHILNCHSLTYCILICHCWGSLPEVLCFVPFPLEFVVETSDLEVVGFFLSCTWFVSFPRGWRLETPTERAVAPMLGYTTLVFFLLS